MSRLGQKRGDEHHLAQLLRRGNVGSACTQRLQRKMREQSEFIGHRTRDRKQLRLGQAFLRGLGGAPERDGS